MSELTDAEQKSAESKDKAHGTDGGWGISSMLKTAVRMVGTGTSDDEEYVGPIPENGGNSSVGGSGSDSGYDSSDASYSSSDSSSCSESYDSESDGMDDTWDGFPGYNDPEVESVVLGSMGQYISAGRLDILEEGGLRIILEGGSSIYALPTTNALLAWHLRMCLTRHIKPQIAYWGTSLAFRDRNVRKKIELIMKAAVHRNQNSASTSMGTVNDDVDDAFNAQQRTTLQRDLDAQHLTGAAPASASASASAAVIPGYPPFSENVTSLSGTVVQAGPDGTGLKRRGQHPVGTQVGSHVAETGAAVDMTATMASMSAVSKRDHGIALMGALTSMTEQDHVGILNDVIDDIVSQLKDVSSSYAALYMANVRMTNTREGKARMVVFRAPSWISHSFATHRDDVQALTYASGASSGVHPNISGVLGNGGIGAYTEESGRKSYLTSLVFTSIMQIASIGRGSVGVADPVMSSNQSRQIRILASIVAKGVDLLSAESGGMPRHS